MATDISQAACIARQKSEINTLAWLLAESRWRQAWIEDYTESVLWSLTMILRGEGTDYSLEDYIRDVRARGLDDPTQSPITFGQRPPQGPLDDGRQDQG